MHMVDMHVICIYTNLVDVCFTRSLDFGLRSGNLPCKVLFEMNLRSHNFEAIALEPEAS